MFNKKMTFQYMAKQITQRKLSLFFLSWCYTLRGQGEQFVWKDIQAKTTV